MRKGFPFRNENPPPNVTVNDLLTCAGEGEKQTEKKPFAGEFPPLENRPFQGSFDFGAIKRMRKFSDLAA